MLSKAISSLLFIACINAHFLQCDPEDSLESIDDLQEYEYAEKAGVVCDEWPFYSGGFAPHHRYSRDSSSSSSEEDDSSEDDSYPSLLPYGTTSDSILYGFDDEVETHECVSTSSAGFCTKWITTKREYEDSKKGCHGRYHHDKDATILTEYQLCLCADSNLGEIENDLASFKTNIGINLASTQTAESLGTYCEIWACLETAEYPTDYNAYSLKMDNDFVVKYSWDSSDSSDDSSDDEEDHWREPTYNGDYYRFAKDGDVMELDESMELQNCWCKSSALNGKYCLNWYCESLEHDEYGCHKSGFGVNDYGWFGCYDNSDDIMDNKCRSWYGFLVDDEDRDEYRCQCSTEDCQEWICGLKEIPLRRNYMWYNFPLAMILWVCLCGCCGTKQCYKRKFSKCNRGCFKALKCRKCRLFTFYILFATASLLHGGVPAFLFFNIFFPLSICCAYKCENCKCRCSKYRGKCGKKWEMNTNNTELVNSTGKDGEDSKEKEDSLSMDKPTPETEQVSKSGHIRVNSIDLDEIDGDDVQV